MGFISKIIQAKLPSLSKNLITIDVNFRKVFKMHKLLVIPALLLSALGCSQKNTITTSPKTANLNVAEQRIAKADKNIATANKYGSIISSFKNAFIKSNAQQQKTVINKYSNELWRKAVADLQASDSNFDDRSLYWARLKLSKAIKELSNRYDQPILWEMERASRGQSDISFSNKATKKVLITGFDPFYLDRNIAQSNPSGLAALMLDGKMFEVDGEVIQIESAIFPVRFVDFDHGEVERFLKPYLKHNSIDMLVTISMGRENFDLERFPALRRSSEAPGNLNVYTGGNKTNPLIPMLGSQPLTGDEFVEFSLPVKAMQSVQTPYKVNDRHTVTILQQNLKPKTFDPKTLSELKNATSVAGSGGGYLSNEISYRSINLGKKLGSKVPTGHLHTPRIKGFEPEIEKQIVQQIEKIIIAGALSLEK